jgi:uncharacterized protein (TIGR03083 family)
MTLTYDRRLELVAEQSAALAAAVGSGDLTDPVPSCPGWTLRDLLVHHGNVLRGWAAVVSAADPANPPAWMSDEDATPPWDGPGEDVQSWYVGSRHAIHDALAAAGEDGPAWTWWGEPATAGAIARHQVQEACVHRYDAQVAAGLDGKPLPHDAAVDGVEEFLTVSLAAEPPPWEGPRTVVALCPEDARPWLLSGDGGSITAGPFAAEEATPMATVNASASDLVLLLYGRLPVSRLEVGGDRSAAAALLDS